MRKRTATIAALTVAAAIGLGCGAGTDTGEVSTGGVAAPAADSSTAAASTAKMGADSVKFDNGITVTAGKPAKFKPSSTAFGHEPGNTAFSTKITFTNGTGEAIDLNLVEVTATIGADGTQATNVIDVQKNITGFDTTVPAGGKASATFAFSAPTKDTSAITVTVSPSFLGSRTAIFTGKL